MTNKYATWFPTWFVLVQCVTIICTIIVGIPGLISCNQKVQSTIHEIRPDGKFSCLYDVSYVVGQMQYEKTVGHICPSSKFNGTQLNLCYSYFKPSKCEAMSRNYTNFAYAMLLTCVAATMIFSTVCMIISFVYLKKGSIVEQVQVTPV